MSLVLAVLRIEGAPEKHTIARLCRFSPVAEQAFDKTGWRDGAVDVQELVTAITRFSQGYMSALFTLNVEDEGDSHPDLLERYYIQNGRYYCVQPELVYPPFDANLLAAS